MTIGDTFGFLLIRRILQPDVVSGCGPNASWGFWYIIDAVENVDTDEDVDTVEDEDADVVGDADEDELEDIIIAQ